MRLLFVAVLLATALGAQNYNWIQSPSNGHWYALTAPMTWAAAEAESQRLGGHLVTVRSQLEHDWLLQTYPSQDLWIGMSDAVVEGVWEWSSGEPVSFTRWCAGEPNNNGGGENYAHIFWALNSATYCRGYWNDICPFTCILLPGIIELPASGTYSAYRQSCASSSGLPQLSNLDSPSIGRAFHLQITGLGAFKVGYLLFGFQDQFWGLNQLPLDLTAFGAAGCFVNIDWVVEFVVPTNAQGIASPTLRIPNCVGLLGFGFYNQFVTIDDAPPGRALRITTTNAGHGVIGF